mmetsp:Transcript_48104/g.55406  ORF Transcript_48104/g.55406 Transcript_48104/m.55406 type:complete len:676 (-) Transcript_48104:153-2180(-)
MEKDPEPNSTTKVEAVSNTHARNVKLKKKLATKNKKKKKRAQNNKKQKQENDNYSDSDDSIISDSENEDASDYRKGGYHPVNIGDVFISRYVILGKLGWGHFSTVWLAKDRNHNKHVALKIQKSERNFYEAAIDEIEILQLCNRNLKKPEWLDDLAGYHQCSVEEVKADGGKNRSYIVGLLNSFIHHGPNGKHYCMVFEIMGCNLLELIKLYDYHGIPIPYARRIAKQLLISMDYIHRVNNIINTDVKPENVLLCLTPQEVEDLAERVIKRNPVKKISEPSESTKGLSKKEKVKLKKKLKKKKKKQEKKKAAAKNSSNKDAKNSAEDGANDDDDGDEDNDEEEKDGVEEDNDNDGEVGDKEDGDDSSSKASSTISPEKSTSAESGLENSLANMNLSPNQSNSTDESEQKGNDGEDPKHEREYIKLTNDVQIKLVDFGNACYTDKHFTSDIQTRQYRSPEVIVGLPYNEKCDMWSVACIIFELITGDLLFEPKQGKTFEKEDDHLAQMMELLGKPPKRFIQDGKMSKEYFTKAGDLKKIHDLQIWPLRSVLLEKYHINEEETEALCSFLLPMLEVDPEKRASAQEVLKHEWLNRPDVFQYKLTKEDRRRLKIRDNRHVDIDYSSGSSSEGDTETKKEDTRSADKNNDTPTESQTVDDKKISDDDEEGNGADSSNKS